MMDIFASAAERDAAAARETAAAFHAAFCALSPLTRHALGNAYDRPGLGVTVRADGRGDGPAVVAPAVALGWLAERPGTRSARIPGESESWVVAITPAGRFAVANAREHAAAARAADRAAALAAFRDYAPGSAE
jgi:hypothetical protein